MSDPSHTALAAAQSAAASASSAATSAAHAANLIAEPADAAVAALVGDSGSDTATALSATIEAGTATLVAEDYPTRQAALDAAPAGATVLFTASHALSGGDFYTVPRPLTIRLLPGVEIDQQSYGHPIFDCFNVDGVRIDGRLGLLKSSATRGDWDLTQFRSDSLSMYWSAVWSNGSYNDFDVRTDGFTCGVYLSGRDAVTNNHVSKSKNGNRVNIIASNVDFALNALCQVDLSVPVLIAKGIKQHTGAFPAPHAIYISGIPTLRSERVSCGVLMCSDNPYSSAFQLRNTDGMTVDSMLADTSRALLALLDVSDVQINQGRLASLSGSTPTTVADITITSGTNNNIRIGTLAVPQMTTTAAGNMQNVVVKGTNIYIDNLIVTSNITDATSPVAQVYLDGTDITVNSIDAKQSGFGQPVASIGANIASDKVRIGRLKCNTSRNIINIQSGATNVSLSYNPKDVATAAGQTPVRPINGSSVGYTASLDDYERAFSVAGAAVASNRPDCFLSTRTYYKITDSAAWTMSNHLSTPFVGQVHEIYIENGTAGALGAATWPATWTVTAYSAPAAGAVTRLRFRWNGTSWAQVV